MLRSTIPRLDVRCCATPRHRSTGTQTGACHDLQADAAATVVELVHQCTLKYETVARRHRQQLAGLESVLGRLRQDGVGCPDGLDARALHGATVETLARAAARDFSARDKVFREHLRWMQNACAHVYGGEPSHTVCAVSARRDRNSRAGACRYCSRVCTFESSAFRSDLQHGYFSRQLRVVYKECERQCTDAREQLHRALAEAALASAREEEARARCDQIVAEVQQQMKELEAANEKSQHELQRTRLKLHTARRKVLEQKWALTYAEPLARQLAAATAAADAAGVLPSQIQAERDQRNQRLHPNRSVPRLPINKEVNVVPQLPVQHQAREKNNSSNNSTFHDSSVHTRQRRFSAPNILFDGGPAETSGPAAGLQLDDTSFSSQAQTPQAANLAPRSWAPVAGPRSSSVIAVVHALSNVQRMLNDATKETSVVESQKLASTSCLDVPTVPLEARFDSLAETKPHNAEESSRQPRPPPRRRQGTARSNMRTRRITDSGRKCSRVAYRTAQR